MIILLDLMGGVALLLWGLHMVNTGVIPAFGADFRRILGSALRNRWRAFAAGVGITAVLQSSTATALLTSSLAARGMVELVPALAIMLGANVGTSLVVQLLSLNIWALAPVLLVAGVLAFRQGKRTIIRDLGRVAVGPTFSSRTLRSRREQSPRRLRKRIRIDSETCRHQQSEHHP